jgi:hypothetical protein
MPQELSVTFSRGQEQPSDGAQATTPVVASDGPILVHAEGPLGASQGSPFTSTFSLSQASLEVATLTDIVNPTIPTGVRFRPSLRLGMPGRAARLKTRQLWEGTITEVRKDGFAAVLSDKTNPKNPDEQANFDFDNTEISPEDVKFINPGSSFYWVIGNEQTIAGQVKNVSMLQFRRVPAWTQRTLERATDRARLLRKSLQE